MLPLVLWSSWTNSAKEPCLQVRSLITDTRISSHVANGLDGAGLFCGVLKDLLERGASCPKVIATTHFHDVFQNDLLSPYKLPITFVHMQILLESRSDRSLSHNPDDDEDNSIIVTSGDRITYLYKCVPSLTSST